VAPWFTSWYISRNYQSGKSFNIYPLPAADYFMINYPQQLKENSVLSIYDITGKEMLSSVIESSSTKIQTNMLPEGIYIVKIISGENRSSAKLIIKRN